MRDMVDIAIITQFSVEPHYTDRAYVFYKSSLHMYDCKYMTYIGTYRMKINATNIMENTLKTIFMPSFKSSFLCAINSPSERENSKNTNR